MKSLFNFALIVIILMLQAPVFACTTVIISGSHTTDGRPVLWKHRDTGFYQNKLMYFEDGKYTYIGLVNSADEEGSEVWGGTNSTGFAIMNSASYNLKVNDDTKLQDQEGVLMKKALQQCATLVDFEKLLNELPKPLGVEANFGVIDANGGAAYYETTNFEFRKFDVNDPKIAPYGYLVRTNHSISGIPNKGYGYIRYQQAENLFYNGAAMDQLNAEYIINHVTRDLHHALTGIDLTANSEPAENLRFMNFEDFIPRYSSVADVLVQGVKPGENPDNTLFWSILGFQLTSVAVPVWVKGGKDLPTLLVADETGNAPLCDKALKLKALCFPINRGSGSKYINISVLFNSDGTGIMQHLKPVEQKIIQLTNQKTAQWEKDGISEKQVQSFYKWIDDYVTESYHRLFGI